MTNAHNFLSTIRFRFHTLLLCSPREGKAINHMQTQTHRHRGVWRGRARFIVERRAEIRTALYLQQARRRKRKETMGK